MILITYANCLLVSNLLIRYWTSYKLFVVILIQDTSRTNAAEKVLLFQLLNNNVKKICKYTHGLNDNVSTYSHSFCGTHINIQKFKDGLPHTAEFEVNLPFDDILA